MSNNNGVNKIWRSYVYTLIKGILSILSVIIIGIISLHLVVIGQTSDGLKGLSLSFLLYLLLGKLNSSEDAIREFGYYSLPGWSGHAMWYGFNCPECGSTSVDYVHGWATLACSSCELRINLKGKRFYKNDGRPAPSPIRTLFEALQLRWQIRRKGGVLDKNLIDQAAKIEDDMGIKVLIVPKDDELKS